MDKKVKVAIADDERMVCVVVENSVEWDELDFELVGIAHDGSDLLRLIKDKNPDIVITDISMPEISGLELIKQIRQENLQTRFIIISGYRQFEYAQDALKYKVDDYLLKPINAQELNEALLKLKYEIISEQSREKDAITTSVQTTKSKENIRRIFLKQLLQSPEGNRLNLSDIEENYGIAFQRGLYQALYAKLDIVSETAEVNEGLVSLSAKIVRVFNKIFEPYCHEILANSETGKIIFVINYPEYNSKNIVECNEDFFIHAKNIVDMFNGISLTVGVGNSYSDVLELNHSIFDATEAIYYRITMGINRIIWFNKLNKLSKAFDEKATKAIMDRITRDFEALDANDYAACVDELFSLYDAYPNIPELFRYCFEIVTTFFDLQKKLNVSIPNEDYTRNRILQKISNATNLTLLNQIMRKELTNIINRIIEEKRSQAKKPIKEAIKFIEANYQKPISLGEVAEVVWLNPVYFSNIFKKETGENFVDYLHKYRINIAKEYLRTSNDTVSQICYAVGYDDPNYFVKLFRKYVGLTPTEYRKIYG